MGGGGNLQKEVWRQEVRPVSDFLTERALRKGKGWVTTQVIPTTTKGGTDEAKNILKISSLGKG